MASIPELRPEPDPDELRRARPGPAASRCSTAPTQARYPPGSTFKVVTAAAALDTRQGHARVDRRRVLAKEISGVPLSNSGGAGLRPDHAHRRADQLGQHRLRRGRRADRPRTLVEYMERFGFNEDPELDYPDDQMLASGVATATAARAATASTSAASRSARAAPRAQIQVDPAADGAGAGGDRQRRQADEAAPDRARSCARTARRRSAIEPDQQAQVMKPRDRRPARRDDEPAWSRRAPAPPPRSPGIDVAGKTGTAEVAQRDVQPGLVHRLRARGESADGGRRDRRAPADRRRAARWRRRSRSRCSQALLGGGG